MHAKSRFRLRFISAIVLLLGVIFITRLYFLQIVHGKDFLEEARGQYIATLPTVYDRGTVYFKGKNGKLVAGATLSGGYVIAINPKILKNPKEVYEKIASIIPLDEQDFFVKAKKENDPYEEIATKIPEAQMKQLKDLNISGLQAFHHSWRYYPGGSLAAAIIGFVGHNGDILSGQYGLEAYYNDTLTRRDENLYVNFFAELFRNLSTTIFDRSQGEEGDLVLTIEPTVQGYLETELNTIAREWKSDETGGIIMDPRTGAIYAMAVNPTFDLNQFGKVKDPRVYANPIVQNVYEMGSTVKPLTMAAGLDAGVVNARTLYNDSGYVTLNNRTFGNFDGKARGESTSMQEVLSQSLNTGVAFVASRLGNERFAEYFLKKFRLGEETGIDLPGEREGLVSNLSSKRDIEYATASFGQGIAVTPINMTASLSILANGGVTVSPHVVDEIRYESNKIKKFSPTPPTQAIKRETSEEITRMLVAVVDDALLGGTVKIPEYSIAAKTGTAQIAKSREDGGGYYDDRYLHTFFGYFPAYDPKFIVFLYTYYPKEAQYASHTLTHPFMRTAKFLLHYYAIAPDRDAQGSVSLSQSE